LTQVERRKGAGEAGPGYLELQLAGKSDLMDLKHLPENPYLLLTPGPLSTTKSVKAAMLRDWCTWDTDYHEVVQEIRRKLVRIATDREGYTSVLMQGSGTFTVEAVIGSVIPPHGKLLVLANGAYGRRMAQIAERLGIALVVQDEGETSPPREGLLRETLDSHRDVTHVAMVHCETTTGMLNPPEGVARIVGEAGKTFILDAMSSFGGIPLDVASLGVDFLISSSNKCIQGVPGLGFVVARREALEMTRGWARSLSLDLYDQWEAMEKHGGKWRYTSPTHVVRAFARALEELDEEGGVAVRHGRYKESQRVLVEGMRDLGFQCLLPHELHSPIITSFLNPDHPRYSFKTFYEALKSRGFVVYPGKVTTADTFRIGNIGDVYPRDMERLLEAVAACMYWR